MRLTIKSFYLAGVVLVSTGFNWGFFGHQKINRLAVFTLPPQMIAFYKANIEYITEASVNPDKRRYAVVDEAARHYIDLDHYGDSALIKMPKYWKQAVEKYSEDTLKAYGIVPWHIERMYNRLRDAFMLRDPSQILKVSAEIGHYIADAHVPLHTTENYNGQLTGQDGIHGFWESRLPELFSDQYKFLTGKATYIENTQLEAWKGITLAHTALDSVFIFERILSQQYGEKKFSFEQRGKIMQRNYSREFAHAYHEALSGMVERHMKICIKRIGSFWYSAWVDAGQPDLTPLVRQQPSKEELSKRRQELNEWRKVHVVVRPHEN